MRVKSNSLTVFFIVFMFSLFWVTRAHGIGLLLPAVQKIRAAGAQYETDMGRFPRLRASETITANSLLRTVLEVEDTAIFSLQSVASVEGTTITIFDYNESDNRGVIDITVRYDDPVGPFSSDFIFEDARLTFIPRQLGTTAVNILSAEIDLGGTGSFTPLEDDLVGGSLTYIPEPGTGILLLPLCFAVCASRRFNRKRVVPPSLISRT